MALIFRRELRGFRATALLFACLTVLLVGSAASEQLRPGDEGYRYKAGDRLFLSVPERPALNREMVIEANGTVTLPLIGSIEVEGLSQPEMQAKVFKALNDLYPSIKEDSFSISPVLGVVIYVTGEVADPGQFSFATAPTLWEAIREAGGPSGKASLGEVRVVADETKGGESHVYDVLSALETGSVDKLPLLNDGDTVVIPSSDEEYTGSQGVNVFGAVGVPGLYRLQGRQDLMSVLLLAGGPTPRASLGDVKIIRVKDDGSFETLKVNLKKYLDDGDLLSNPNLRPGDTVNVPEQNAIGYQLKNNITVITGVIASVVSIILLWDRFGK